jgi:hypothetical protein
MLGTKLNIMEKNNNKAKVVATPDTIEVIFVKNPIVINMAYSIGDVVTFPSNKALALIEDGLAKNYDGLPLPVEEKKVSYLKGEPTLGQ